MTVLLGHGHVFSPANKTTMLKKYLSAFSLTALLALSLTGCDEGTGIIGSEIMPPHDEITTADSVFRINTQTLAANPDSIVANTNDCYLGSLIDPETNTRTTCDFLAQFHVTENFSLPPIQKMIKGEDGKVHADSVNLTLYFDTFTGDSLTTMMLTVHELDKNNVLREDTTYSTNINPAEFVSADSQNTTSVNYAINDLSSHLSTTTFYRTINLQLPRTFGDRLLQSYYDDPSNFSNPYKFVRNVCPGFYFEHSGGTGAMLKAYVSAIHLYFSYKENDSIISGVKRMASTGEVIQSTRADNSPLDKLLNQGDCTYLRSPAGLFTEVEIPVGDIVTGRHYTDSINNARISFRRLNATTTSKFALQQPANVLLLPKSQMYQFFREKRLPDNRTAFLTPYNSANNAYTFSDISNLITWMKEQRNIGAGVTEADDEQTRQQKWESWEASHPDWNKAVLMPVSTEQQTSTSTYGTATTTVYGVNNMYGLSSVRLEGGAGFAPGSGPVELGIIYSHYSK